MNENGRIRFAVVGCGHIGKRHAAMIVNNKECELVALSDSAGKDQLGIEDYAVPFFSSVDALLRSGIAVDVLCIATPNGLHEEQAVKGLRAGCHVVIEKPMALSKAGCERIISEALRCHKYVFCVMQNRYSPPSVWLKDIIEKKLLGEIYMVQINCYWNRDHRYYKEGNWHGTKDLDGGTLFTQFSHFIDSLFWLFGDIESVNGRFRSFNHAQYTWFEDSAFINFDFVNGGMGSLNYSTSVWEENLESSLTVIGEKGSVKVGGQYMDRVEKCHIKDYTLPELPRAGVACDYGSYKGSAANHHYIFETVADVLKGRIPFVSNAPEALKVVEIIERIYQLKSN